MSNVIVFYDLINQRSTAEERAWSPNTWKTRLSLGFKGLPFRTVWVEYPDIESLCKKIGAAPTDTRDGAPLYTLPVIHDPSTGKSISDSWDIAKYLDETYPDRPLLLPKGTHALQWAFIEAAVEVALRHVRKLNISQVAAQLRPRSEGFWRAPREKAFGCKLEDLSTGEGREQDWRNAEKGLTRVVSWLQKNGEQSSWVMGESVCFADLVIGSWFFWATRVAPEAWERIKGLDNGFWDRYVQGLDLFAVFDEGEEYQD